MDAKVLAIIPARGGSKRVENKNVREVDGKPLIAHTIEQARNASLVDVSIVSTDDEKIKETARKYGGSVPFDRPEKFAQDTSPTSSVVTHAIDWYSERNESFDIICVLQVTSPLRTADDIDNALLKLENSSGDSVVAVSEYFTPPHWAVTLGTEAKMTPLVDSCPLWNDNNVRSQDLDTLYHPNGSIFATYVDTWRNEKSFYTSNSKGYVMPPRRGLDIDEPWELELIRDLI